MTVRPILTAPDPRLQAVSTDVETVDDALRALIDDMADSMYAAEGIGLAATQVDVHERVIVIDVSDERSRPLVLINPELLQTSEEMVQGDEGCLSVPTIYDTVSRHARVTVRALGRDGQPFELEAEGLLSVCIQHEMDHLQGKVFVEYLSALKRNMILRRLAKEMRQKDSKGS